MTRLRRLVALVRDDTGSSPVEFVLVGVLLTALTFGVLQFGFAVYVRNVVHDAAVEGAFRAALADTTLADGVRRTSDVITRTVGGDYASEVRAAMQGDDVVVTVTAPLPVFGLWGAPRMLEVTARAPVESFD